MSTGAIIAIVIAIIVVVAAVALAAAEMRRRTLRQRFGPEYDRLASEKGTRQAEAELAARQRRVAKLDIRPLTPDQRATYARQWTATQELFVDDPGGAVRQAEGLVTAVQRDRGYPVDSDEEAMDALIVHHADTIDGYREARGIMSDRNGTSTDNLRKALLGYRALYRELLGGSPTGEPVLDNHRPPAIVSTHADTTTGPNTTAEE